MRMSILASLLLVVILVLASGCITSPGVSNTETQMKDQGGQGSANLTEIARMCVELCKGAKDSGEDLSSGPCLSNDLYPGWVCDVAHWPRLPVDNDPANQCPAFGKTAHSFVEVDPDCQVIRVYQGH